MSQPSAASSVTLSSAPPMGAKLGSQLSIMMFLQYAIWGAWLPILWPFLADYRSFNAEQIGTMFAMGAIGALLAPFVAGQIADRYFNTERFLGLSHIIGGLLIWQLSSVGTFVGFLLFSLIYSILYSPTLPLTNSLAFHHLPDRDRDFGRVRVWGTIGWIAAGITVGQWLSHTHTINEEEATSRLVQEHLIDANGRARFTEAVQVTLSDAKVKLADVNNRAGSPGVMEITFRDPSPMAGTKLIGAEVDRTKDVLVLNIAKEKDKTELVAVKLIDVAGNQPLADSLVRPERLAEVKAAAASLAEKKDEKAVTETLLKYSKLSHVQVRGGESQVGDDVIVQTKTGDVAGKLLARTTKLHVVEDGEKHLHVILAADLKSDRKSAGDPVIGAVDTDKLDADPLVVTVDGQTKSIPKADVVKVTPYSVFTAETVAGKINMTQAAGRADAFKLSGILGILMGLFCFTLPSTPPSPGKQQSATAEAMVEIRKQPLLTLFLLAVPISCIHQFYFVHTSGFVSQYQNKAEGFMNVMNAVFGKGGGGFMTIGQITEMLVLACIPLVAKRWSRKSLLALGIVAYGLRMFLFAYVDMLPLPPVLTIVLGVALHGFCFGCFIFVAFMVVDEETTGDVRASAQSLFNFVIVGIGIIVGSKFAGWVYTNSLDAAGKVVYSKLFAVPMWISVACLFILLAAYPGKRKTAELQAN